MCAACSIISVLTQWGATLVIKLREREREREVLGKAGAWQDTSYDPELRIKRGCAALATKPLHDCANADPEPAYTTNGASTRHIGSIAADVQAQLARDAVRADDKDRGAADTDALRSTAPSWA